MNKNTQIETLYSTDNSLVRDTVGNSIRVDDFAHLVLQIDVQGSPSLKMKIQGSCSDTCPTFSSAQSRTNVWTYITALDMTTESSISGKTGIAFTSADYRMIKIGYAGLPIALKWVNVIFMDYTTGSPYITILKSNNV